MDNNISPLKNEDHLEQKRDCQEFDDLDYALNNSGSDFNVDYIDEDDLVPNSKEKINKIIHYEP